MSGNEVEDRSKGGNVVAVAGGFGFVGDADGGSGGVEDRGEGKYGQD